MAVTTFDSLVGALTAGETRAFYKLGFTAEAIGSFHSLWKVPGYPHTTANPGGSGVNGEIPTDATAGAFPFTNAAGSNYLAYFSVASATAGTLIVYDRLYHSATLSGTATGTNAITQPALTRYTDGIGVELWAEFYTAIGATAATLTVVYTDEGGTGSNSATYSHPANAETVGQMVPLTLASGDSGVRSVQSYGWSVSTGAAGNFGLVLMKRLLTVPLQTTNVAAVYDAFTSGLREIQDDACIAMLVQCSATAMASTTTPLLNGEFTIGKG